MFDFFTQGWVLALLIPAAALAVLGLTAVLVVSITSRKAAERARRRRRLMDRD